VAVRRHGAFSLRLGYSMLAGGMALGLIMLPLFARIGEEAIARIPRTVEEGGLGLGLPRRRVVLRILLRAAAAGLLTGAFLALARVAGEAAPLLFTAFGTSSDHPTGLLEKTWSLPVCLYSYFDQGAERLDQAWAASLVLVSLVLLIRLAMNLLARRHTGGTTGTP